MKPANFPRRKETRQREAIERQKAYDVLLNMEFASLIQASDKNQTFSHLIDMMGVSPTQKKRLLSLSKKK